MLWYKAWCETRVRFLLIALLLTGFCIFTIFSTPGYLHPGAHSAHVYDAIYAGTAKGLFTLLIIFLGLGGLQRERSHHTAIFTLALPVSRRRVVGTQIALGIFELAALALLPAVLLPALSPLIQETYPVSEALHFSALWFAGGILIYSVSFLLAVVAPGEFTAPVACYLLLVTHTVAAQWRPLAPYRLNLLWRMGEFRSMEWDAGHTLLLPPPLSWPAILVMTVISIALLGVAMRVTERQDF